MAAGWCSIILAPFLDLSVLRCAIKIPKAGFGNNRPRVTRGFYKEKKYAKHGLRFGIIIFWNQEDIFIDIFKTQFFSGNSPKLNGKQESFDSKHEILTWILVSNEKTNWLFRAYGGLDYPVMWVS